MKPKGKSKMIKKISALLLALMLCTGILAGCSSGKTKDDSNASGVENNEGQASNGDNTATSNEDTTGPSAQEIEGYVPEPALNIDGKELDVSDLVVCTIDGKDIKFDEFRFYYYYTINKYTETWGITEDMLKENGELFAQFKEDVIATIKQELVAQKLADENGLVLDDDDIAAVETQYQAAKANCASEEEYAEILKQGFLTDELYKKMLNRAQIYSKVMSTLFANDGVYATSGEEFLKLVQDKDEYAHEVHVMVPFYALLDPDLSETDGLSYDDMTLNQKREVKSAAYQALDDAGRESAKAEAKALADEVCKKARDGEDFYKLVDAYGWDIGLTDPNVGYYIQKDNIGGYPQELLDEAFALDIGEISDEPVENPDYGYFIVMRTEPDMEYVEDNLAAMINSHDQPRIQEKFAETIDSMSVTYFSDWDKLTADSVS